MCKHLQCSKNQFLKNLCSGTHRRGFQFLLNLDLWGISSHAVVVFGLGKNLLFKSVLGHCAIGMTCNFTNLSSNRSTIAWYER